MKYRIVLSAVLIVLILSSGTTIGQAQRTISATQPQQQAAGALRSGATPFNLGDSMVFGVPKESFQTQVLYNVGPTASRSKAVAHNGRQPNEPLTMRQWRQIVFELSMNRLNPTILPDYIAYLTRAHDVRWDHSPRKGEPLLIADVWFEWLADSEKTSTPHAAPALSTNQGRFFGASLLPEVLNSRFVTLLLSSNLIYSNSNDTITGITLSIDSRDSFISMNSSQVIDLGDDGDKTACLIAYHRSGQQSQACFAFALLTASEGVGARLHNWDRISQPKDTPTVRFTEKDSGR
jgi:hypothetical protein